MTQVYNSQRQPNTWLKPEARCALGQAPFTCWYTRSAAGRLITVVGKLLSCRAARSFMAATASAETSPALCALLPYCIKSSRLWCKSNQQVEALGGLRAVPAGSNSVLQIPVP